MRINFNQKLDMSINYWITSDLHFGHKNILKFCPKTRPFTDVNQMDEYLIAHWNSVVGEDDVVFHLGDFSFYGTEKTERIIDRLNGTIVWVRGNHDKTLAGILQKRGIFMHEYIECKFDGHKVCMMHFPLAEWNQKYRGAIHLHGHQHGGGPKYDGRIMDVGYDGHGFIRNLSSVIKGLIQRNPEPSGERDRG